MLRACSIHFSENNACIWCIYHARECNKIVDKRYRSNARISCNQPHWANPEKPWLNRQKSHGLDSFFHFLFFFFFSLFNKPKKYECIAIKKGEMKLKKKKFHKKDEKGRERRIETWLRSSSELSRNFGNIRYRSNVFEIVIDFKFYLTEILFVVLLSNVASNTVIS